MAAPRFDHLRRLTDTQGLLCTARGEVPDRFSGYRAVENAAALRLCAVGTETVDAEVSQLLARTYFGFLSRGRRYDSGVRHHCDSGGGWTNNTDDSWVQSNLARALAAVIVSELPINIRLSAADWWRMLLEEHAARIDTPLVAANWLIAFGQLRAADPGRDLDRVRELAHWLMEDFYYTNRTSGWEWYAPEWLPLAASFPTGLWHAFHMLGERRIFRVAETMTQFVLDGLIRDDLLEPVGTLGGWQRGALKAQYSQSPAEVHSIIELLCTAERVSGNGTYGEYAEVAAKWFDGHNTKGATMIDPSTGGCYDALTANGVDGNQSAASTLACLLTHAVIASRTVHTREAVLHMPESPAIEVIYSDPSIGS